MSQRFLISVDPCRITFNPLNPRKHQGTELVRLRESIKKRGIVQPPIVRVMPGNFFEAIDGEGRIRIAQEEGFEQIEVLSVGSISADEALMLLQASNTIRSFNLLAECTGLANLHRRGMSFSMLANEFASSLSRIQDMVGIGYFPDDLISTIQENIAQSEDHAKVWTFMLLMKMLPLRELLPGQSVSHGSSSWFSFDGIYNYREVDTAIKMVIQGEIKTGEQMGTYVVYRKYEIFQTRFNEELERKLQEEMAIAKQELEAAKKDIETKKELEVKNVKKQIQEVQTAKNQLQAHYEEQIIVLNSQLNSFAKKHTQVVNEVVKSPDMPPAIIAEREQQLTEALDKTQKERVRLQKLQQEAEEEARKAQESELKIRMEVLERQERWERNNKQILEDALIEQRKAQALELEKSASDLKEYYDQKSQDLQIKAENTIRGLLSRGIKSLTEAQQIVDHIVSPALLESVRSLGGAHHENLLWAIRSMSEALDRAEQKLVDGDLATHVEGGITNGYQQYSSDDFLR